MQAMQVDRMTEDTQLQSLRERERGREGGREEERESTDQGNCLPLSCRSQCAAGSAY